MWDLYTKWQQGILEWERLHMDDTDYRISIVKRNEPYTMEAHHYHNYYEIYFLLSGKRGMFIKDTLYEVTKGSILFINKFDLHKTVNTDVIEHERIGIYFSDHFIEQFHGQEIRQSLTLLFAQRNRMLQLNLQEQAFAEHLMRQMYQEFIQPQSHHKLYIEGLLVQLLIYMARINSKTPSKKDPLNPTTKKILEIIEYCNLHFNQPLMLSDVSQQCFMSTFHFSRMFKKITGFTFTEYMNTLRVKEAQILIRETDMKIIEISEQVGFSSLTHFGRIFKQITQLSPTQYKKTIHKS